jgi:hypothetical protein
MTANSDLISRQNCIYVSHSGRRNQTEHSSDKMVKIPGLDLLLMPLLDSRNLIFDVFQAGDGE